MEPSDLILVLISHQAEQRAGDRPPECLAIAAYGAFGRPGTLDDVELKLGMMCTIGPRRFVPFLQAFRERHPKVNLVVKDGSNEELQERLAQGELDIAVYGQPEAIDERFHARRLYDERFVIGVGPGHPFEKQNAVRCADLHEQSYVNRLQCEFFGHAGKIFRSQGAKTRIVFRSDRDDWGPVHREQMSRMRRTIAANMVRSVSTIPHLTNFDDADVTELERLRKASAEDHAKANVKLTALSFVSSAS